MFNEYLCAEKVIFALTLSYAFLLSCTSFLSSPASVFRIFMILLIISDSVESLTIRHSSQIDPLRRRIERGVSIVVENREVPPNIFLKPYLRVPAYRFLTESSNRVITIRENGTGVEDGNFNIQTAEPSAIKIDYSKKLMSNELVFVKINRLNAHICMTTVGTVYVQIYPKMSDLSLCVWYFEETAYGIRFINFLMSFDLDKLSYMAISNSPQHVVSRHVANYSSMDSNTIWIISAVQSTTLEEIPSSSSSHRFSYKSLVASINVKNIEMCNEIKGDLAVLTFTDIEESVKVMKQVKTGMTYLRIFLLSHSFSRDEIKTIMRSIKKIILFYGHKTRKKLFGIVKINASQCLLKYFKFCTTFRIKRKLFKKMKHSFMKRNRFLIRLVVRATQLNYFEKMRWLKDGDFMDFIRDALFIPLPPKKTIMKASYILLQHASEEDPLHIDSQQFKHSKYIDLFFARKLEELSFQAAITMTNSSLQTLDGIYRKLEMLDQKSKCYETVTENLLNHSRCPQSANMKPCLSFSFKYTLYTG